jgi:flagellar basal body P-ring formation protein FlgA
MKNTLFALLAVITLHAAPAWAGKAQSLGAIRETAEAFARAQTKGIPGKVTIQVAELDKRLNLPACPKLEAFLPPAAQLNGNSSVGVRCISQQNWSIFVPVNIKISITMLTINKTLQQGQTVHAEDLGSLTSESLQTGTLTDPAQAIGKIMKFGVGAGQILRYDMLRAPYTVKQGQAVKVQVLGSGFRVASDAQALSNAADGDTTTARTASGQLVSGIVKGGIIEINP